MGVNKVLIIDDDIHVGELVGSILPDCDCLTVIDGHHLRENLLYERPDLILMDVHMPGKSGLEWLAWLKEDEQFRDIPVIMITGDDDEDLLARCFSHGAADFINKPISETVLRARVHNVLSIKHARQRLLQVNRELRDSGRRMAQLLDTSGVGLLTIDHRRMVLYANRLLLELMDRTAAEVHGFFLKRMLPALNEQLPIELAGVKKDAAGLPIAGPFQLAIGPEKETAVICMASVFAVGGEDSGLYAIRLIPASLKPGMKVPEGMGDTKNTEYHGSSFELLIGEMWQLLRKDGGLPSLSQEQQENNGASSLQKEETSQQELRALAVETLNLALETWEAVTRKTKIELSEESGLWSVYVEKEGTWRTRSLDRYLKLKSLPKQPQWRKVLLTSRHVLDTIPKGSPRHTNLVQKLEHKTERLQQLLYRSSF